MNKREAAIITAYTGYLIGCPSAFHRYAEELLGGSVFTHEFANKKIWENLQELSRKDFLSISVSVE